MAITRVKPQLTRKEASAGPKTRQSKVSGRKSTKLIAGKLLTHPPTRMNELKTLRERFGVSQQLLSRLSGFSVRAIADWESGKPMSEPGRQRMKELQRLHHALTDVMSEDFIAEWLNTPNSAFETLKPIEVIERGEVDRIWQMIFYLRSGVPT